MAQDFTTYDLVADIKRRASIPNFQNRFSADNVVSFLDDELKTVIVPEILNLREEYFVTYQDFTVTAAAPDITIPARAIGMKLRDLTVVESNGAEYSVTFTYPERLTQNSSNSLSEQCYFIRNNKIILAPTPTTTMTVRVYYFKRPNTLVYTDKAAKVSTVNQISGEVVTASSPTSWVTGTKIDAVCATPGFDGIFDSNAIVNKAGNNITFSAATLSTLAAGDWLAAEEESVIPQVPIEAHGVLVQAAIVKIHEALGDTDLMQAAHGKYEQVKSAFVNMIVPRNTGEAKKCGTEENYLWG